MHALKKRNTSADGRKPSSAQQHKQQENNFCSEAGGGASSTGSTALHVQDERAADNADDYEIKPTSSTVVQSANYNRNLLIVLALLVLLILVVIWKITSKGAVHGKPHYNLKPSGRDGHGIGAVGGGGRRGLHYVRVADNDDPVTVAPAVGHHFHRKIKAESSGQQDLRNPSFKCPEKNYPGIDIDFWKRVPAYEKFRKHHRSMVGTALQLSELFKGHIHLGTRTLTNKVQHELIANGTRLILSLVQQGYAVMHLVRKNNMPKPVLPKENSDANLFRYKKIISHAVSNNPFLEAIAKAVRKAENARIGEEDDPLAEAAAALLSTKPQPDHIRDLSKEMLDALLHEEEQLDPRYNAEADGSAIPAPPLIRLRNLLLTERNVFDILKQPNMNIADLSIGSTNANGTVSVVDNMEFTTRVLEHVGRYSRAHIDRDAYQPHTFFDLGCRHYALGAMRQVWLKDVHDATEAPLQLSMSSVRFFEQYYPGFDSMFAHLYDVDKQFIPSYELFFRKRQERREQQQDGEGPHALFHNRLVWVHEKGFVLRKDSTSNMKSTGILVDYHKQRGQHHERTAEEIRRQERVQREESEARYRRQEAEYALGGLNFNNRARAGGGRQKEDQQAVQRRRQQQLEMKKKEGKCVRTESIATVLGYMNGGLSTVKMDIEYSEWQVFQQLHEKDLWSKIGEMFLECHSLGLEEVAADSNDGHQTSALFLQPNGLHPIAKDMLLMAQGHGLDCYLLHDFVRSNGVVTNYWP